MDESGSRHGGQGSGTIFAVLRHVIGRDDHPNQSHTLENTDNDNDNNLFIYHKIAQSIDPLCPLISAYINSILS